MTVTCSDLPYKRLLYEIQYKSVFDTEWLVSGGWCLLRASVSENPQVVTERDVERL